MGPAAGAGYHRPAGAIPGLDQGPACAASGVVVACGVAYGRRDTGHATEEAASPGLGLGTTDQVRAAPDVTEASAPVVMLTTAAKMPMPIRATRVRARLIILIAAWLCYLALIPPLRRLARYDRLPSDRVLYPLCPHERASRMSFSCVPAVPLTGCTPAWSDRSRRAERAPGSRNLGDEVSCPVPRPPAASSGVLRA